MDTDREKLPHFSFSFLNHETHDYLTLSESYDRNLRDLVEYLEMQRYLENSMFILMSDHGSRLTGKYELY